MRNWQLKSGDPLSLGLAADARLASLDYANDQIWELVLGSAEPAALLLQTTYGLRARNMRIFPRFIEGDTSISDPAAFDSPPVVHHIHTNYLALRFSPFPGIDVSAEYWVPQSNLISGQLRFQNNGVIPRHFSLEWVALLNPAAGGQIMFPEKIEGAHVLQGSTTDLFPVIFITGGPVPRSSPYPALQLQLDLLPGQDRQFTWVHAALSDPAESFKLARSTATRKWPAEIARIAMANTSQLEIYTGDPDWDAAFAMGQKTAYGLLHGPTHNLPHRSFVHTRLPDQGYSSRGDGSDYDHLWNGQSPLEAWYLSSYLLPGEAQTAQGLLLNFFAAQNESGHIDWKPGLGGQRGRMLATPILSSLAWRIYQHTQDRAFLETSFPHLLNFVLAWFSTQQDRDGDGLPEWSHPIQSGYDDNPAFAYWHAWAQGADITLFESPALCAFLYRECRTLIEIAILLDHPEPVPALQALAENLNTALQSSWNSRTVSYHYWDRETHTGGRGKILGSRKGPGEITFDLDFDQPTRLLLTIQSNQQDSLNIQASLHGTRSSSKRRVEHFDREQFQWYLGGGVATGRHLFTSLQRLKIKGLPPGGTVHLRQVDYTAHDITLLLPLWTGLPDAAQAQKMIDRTLTQPQRYWRSFGLPASPKPPKHPDAAICASVWLPWNSLIGEGLLAYGARPQAVELVTRLMNAAIAALKNQSAFRKHHHADSGLGLGERNHLAGLPPLGLFLETLGVRIISPWQVALDGFNPFPWPVKIQYRGLSLECTADKTLVTFPNGQVITIDDPAPCLVDGQVHLASE
ncbi:MAG: hypothetical protein OEZ02_08580 [Anaerolineae bacterium]|nr:hypothetical protein [Anaerolineae bacterium]